MVACYRSISIVATLVWLSVLPMAQGQGYFFFDNHRPLDGVDAPIYDAEGNGLRGNEYAAALYAGPTLEELEITVHTSSHQPIILPFLGSSVAAGYLEGSPIVEARNVIGGTLTWVQVRAWYVPLGETYEEVQQQGLGGYGESSAFQLIAGHDTGAGILAVPLVGLESFSLRPIIPEPGTLSLLFVALPVLWLAAGRRGKHQIGNDS